MQFQRDIVIMYQYPDYLMHYGVLGMKLGRRRERRAAKKASKIKLQYSRAINKFETFGKENISYGKMATRIGMPKAVRAVANANGANAISIFAPCHRVIGSDHSLTGYGGGLDAKRKLLELEGVFTQSDCVLNL